MSGLRRYIGRIAISGLLTLLVVSGLARIVSAGLSSLPDEQATVAAEPALFCPPSTEVADLLRHIAARDAELDERAAELAMREQDARIAREEIRASLVELQQANDRLEARMHLSDTASEEDVARLVTVYEGMKGKDAAALFETMEPGFAAGFLARLRPDAAASILSNMSPDRAYALSAWIAGRNADAAREDDR